MDDILIYGAYGYTGELVAECAVAAGLRPILGGRSQARLASLAQRLRLPYRVFGLEQPAEVDRGLQDIHTVVHCAGPFSRTAKPMVDACFRRGTHYLDINGELDVFETLRARHEEALKAGVMLLPGTGMDVVPSDCLSAHIASRVAEPARLRLFVHAKTRASRGTMRAMLEGIIGRGIVRRGGRLEPVPMLWKRRDMDFEGQRLACITFPMAELSACYQSTGIGEIETYIALPRAAVFLSPVLPGLMKLLEGPRIRRFLEARIDAAAPGMTAAERVKGFAIVIAEVEDRSGRVTRAMLRLPEPYSFTARAAVLALQKARTAAKAGFQTPSTAFGSDFVLGIEGVHRKT